MQRHKTEMKWEGQRDKRQRAKVIARKGHKDKLKDEIISEIGEKIR